MATLSSLFSIPVCIARTRVSPLASSSTKLSCRSCAGIQSSSVKNIHLQNSSFICSPLSNVKILSNNSKLFKSNASKYQASPRASWNQEVVWAEASIASTHESSESLFDIVVDISDIPELKTGYQTPGQFVQVKIGNSKPAFLAIASPPKMAESGVFEFLVKDVEGSTASELCHLPAGSKIEISQVMGAGFNTESLSSIDEFDTVIIFATGSGISPIRSLIEHGFDAKKRSDVRLYYGARNLVRMAYQNRFKAWEESGVKVIPVLSQPDDVDNWKGYVGFVQAAFSKEIEIKNSSKAGAVLCGQKGMTQDVAKLLTDTGVSKEKILMNF